jgi:hypothetical protein
LKRGNVYFAIVRDKTIEVLGLCGVVTVTIVKSFQMKLQHCMCGLVFCLAWPSRANYLKFFSILNLLLRLHADTNTSSETVTHLYSPHLPMKKFVADIDEQVDCFWLLTQSSQ